MRCCNCFRKIRILDMYKLLIFWDLFIGLFILMYYCYIAEIDMYRNALIKADFLSLSLFSIILTLTLRSVRFSCLLLSLFPPSLLLPRLNYQMLDIVVLVIVAAVAALTLSAYKSLPNIHLCCRYIVPPKDVNVKHIISPSVQLVNITFKTADFGPCSGVMRIICIEKLTRCEEKHQSSCQKVETLCTF